MKKRISIRASRSIMPTVLAFALAIIGLAPGNSAEAYSQRRPASKPQTSKTQTSKQQLQAPLSVYGKGYQKGYNEGFNQGEADWRQGVPRDFQRSDAYYQRDSRYDPNLATSEDYVQGYELGFELGHTDGYYGRPRNAAEPVNGAVLAKAATLANAQRDRERESINNNSRPREVTPQRSEPQRDEPQRNEPQRNESQRYEPQRNAGPINIQAETRLQIRLTSPISTKVNRAGDRFEAIVTTPSEYEGATVVGHIATLNRSGRVSGRTELGLAFDSITLSDGRSAELTAELEKIIESETVKKVDEEGRVESGSRTKDSQVRGGVGAAAGAIIGGIIGGAKGAVLGAVLGGAAGVGTVYVEGSKDLILEPGTEMVIRIERTRSR